MDDIKIEILEADERRVRVRIHWPPPDINEPGNDALLAEQFIFTRQGFQALLDAMRPHIIQGEM